MDFSKFDQLIHIVTEADLPIKEQVKQTKLLFPDFGKHENFDEYLPASKLDMYRYHRGLGLPVAEVANSIGITATMLQKVFRGEGVSLETLLTLAKAETFGLAESKAKHMTILEKGPSTTFLEKAFAKQYSERQAIDVKHGFADGAEDITNYKFTFHDVGNKEKDKRKEEIDGDNEL